MNRNYIKHELKYKWIDEVFVFVALFLMWWSVFEEDLPEAGAWFAVALVLFRYVKLLLASEDSLLEKHFHDELHARLQEEFTKQMIAGTGPDIVKTREIVKIFTDKELIESDHDPTEEELQLWGFDLNYPIVGTRDRLNGYWVLRQDIPDE